MSKLTERYTATCEACQEQVVLSRHIGKMQCPYCRETMYNAVPKFCKDCAHMFAGGSGRMAQCMWRPDIEISDAYRFTQLVVDENRLRNCPVFKRKEAE